MDKPAASRIHGLPSIDNPAARILILGSMPGAASLRAGQYYAHPQNRFWQVLGEVLGHADLREAPYDDRLCVLKSAGIALWDVLASCDRKGSLDTAIAADTLVVNDFAAFFARHRRIERVLFNGSKAADCFRRHVAPVGRDIGFAKLPSTSPANASVPYARKLAEWKTALQFAIPA